MSFPELEFPTRIAVAVCILSMLSSCTPETSSDMNQSDMETNAPAESPAQAPESIDVTQPSAQLQWFEILEGASAPLQRLAELAAEPTLSGSLEKFIEEARADAARSVIRRPDTLDELRASRIPMKYPERPAHASKLDDTNWAIFALSHGDINAANRLTAELPRVAAAGTLTGDPELLQRVLDQIEEVASWEPLQRPGYSMTNRKLEPEPGGEGAWLGTGWMLRALTEALWLIPRDRIPEALHAAVVHRLDREIESLVDDWETARPWYVRQQAVHSNQWVIPTEGLILACLYAGKDRHEEAYELGVGNLLKSLDAQGEQGEYVEGLSYAGMTLTGVLSAASAMAAHGDMRALEHPFLEQFPTWLAHHLQPGGSLINAFNSNIRELSGPLLNVLNRLAAETANPVAIWVLQRHDGYTDTLVGLAARMQPVDLDEEPPLFAHYPIATRLNWRSTWDDATASGFWMRGGHETDFHDHMDRGHVNFQIGDRPMLIEAGTVSFGIAEHSTHFQSVAGHNVLQIGDLPPEELDAPTLRSAGQIREGNHKNAPITVHAMDESGGSATVDVSNAYQQADKWTRDVAWTLDNVTTRDQVILKEPDIVLFRWHLGEPEDAEIIQETGRIQVGNIIIEIDSDIEIAVSVEPMLNGTLVSTGVHRHACVVVRSREPVTTANLETTISFSD